MAAVTFLLCILICIGHSVNGALYTRWGRKTCEGDAVPVYTGYVTSAHITESGSGRNYICLSDKPEWGNVQPGVQPQIASLYFVQYRVGNQGGFSDNKPFSWANFNNQSPDLFPVACVLCQTPNTEVFMLPGKLNCPSDWFNEYSGYLVADHFQNSGSDWVCLDKSPEPYGPKYDSWHAAMYPAEMRCGPLPCSTFIAGNEISCVICSQ